MDPSDAVVASSAVIVGIVFAAILLAMDSVRSVLCKECPHCKRKVEDAARAKARLSHLQFHRGTTIADCEFCINEGGR